MNERPFLIDAAHVISDEAALKSLYEPTHTLAVQKCQDRLGPHAQEFIRRSPFVCIGTQSRDGRADVSPRGDPVGFVKILDERRLAIPDRPGNNRLDSLVNILSNPSVGLLFIVPGFEDTLRVNGRATLVKDPALLESMAVRERAPAVAIVVAVDEVFMHCAKAFRRGGIWEPETWASRETRPSPGAILLGHTGIEGMTADEVEAGLEAGYQHDLAHDRPPTVACDG